MKKMKALRWYHRNDVRVDSLPIPEPLADEVLIKVLYSGICGADVHEYVFGPLLVPLEEHPLTGQKAPQTLGHEFGGIVVKTGENVTGIAIGKLVTVNPILACGICPACLRNRKNLCDKLAYYGLIGDGGHAEYAVVKADNCIPLPENTPQEYVAFGEPAGVAYHAVNQGKVKEGDNVIVIGGGPIGCLVAQYVKQISDTKVTLLEISPHRISIAEKLGLIDKIINPLDVDVTETIMELTNGHGVDCAIECSGGKKTGMLENTVSQAVDLTRSEGMTVVVGTFDTPTEFHFNNVMFMERKIVGSWVWHSHEEYSKAMEMIVDGKIKILPLITKKIKIDDALKDGIETLYYNRDEHLKILIDFT